MGVSRQFTPKTENCYNCSSLKQIPKFTEKIFQIFSLRKGIHVTMLEI
jgi:hypothetical protein